MFKIPHQHPNVHLSYGPVPSPAPMFRQQNSRSTQKLSLHRKLSRTPTPLIFRATRVSISTHNSSLQIFFFSYLLLDPSLSSFSTPGSQLTRWDTSVCLLWSCHLLFTPSTAQFLGKGMPVEGNYFPLSPDMPLTTLVILIIFLPLARPSFWGAKGQSTLPCLMQRLFHSKLYIKPHTNKKIPEASLLWEK